MTRRFAHSYTVWSAWENGESVTVETDRWLCFDRRVMEAIASRPNITVTVNCSCGHRDYTVTIPAGYDVIALLNEDGFCGFRYLDLIFEGRSLSRISEYCTFFRNMTHMLTCSFCYPRIKKSREERIC